MKKTLFITGASSDIGISFIEKYHYNYDIILAHYHNDDSQLTRLQQALGGKIILLQADFNNTASVLSMIQNILETRQFPSHILHLTACKYESVRFSKTNWETFEREINTSLRSIIIILEALLPFMTKQRYGKIVFMLSSYIHGMPPKFSSPYVTVKYALLGLMNELSVEYADKGITVNGVSPSMIETKFLVRVPEYIVQQSAAESPLGRNLTTDDILPSLAFLLSPDADCITGENLFVTGGN